VGQLAGAAAGDGPTTTEMFLTLEIESPADGSSVTGPATGVTLTVSGTWELERIRGRPSVALSVDRGADAAASVSASGQRGSWSVQATITTSGSHTLQVVSTMTAPDGTGKSTTLTAAPTPCRRPR
jgi:hypothetical protein